MNFDAEREPDSQQVSRTKRHLRHIVLIAACFAVFCVKALPTMRIESELSQAMALVHQATHEPETMHGGYFDSYNSNVRNVPYLVYTALRGRMDHVAATLTLHLGIVAVLMSGVYALALAFSNSAACAVATTAILVNSELIGFPCVGANGLPSQITAPCYLFLGLALFAVRFLVVGRPYFYAAILPAAYLCHMPQGMLAFAALLPAAVWIGGRSRRFCLVHIGGMCSLIGGCYLHQAAQSDVVATETGSLWFHYLHLLNCGHLYIDAGLGNWLAFTSFLLVVAAAVLLSLAFAEQRALIVPTCLTGLLIIAAAQPFIYWWPSRTVYLLMPIRLSNFIVALSLTFAVSWAFQKISASRSAAAAAVVAGAVCGGFVAVMIATAGIGASVIRRGSWALKGGGAVLTGIVLATYFGASAEFAGHMVAFESTTQPILLVIMAAIGIGACLLPRFARLQRHPFALPATLAIGVFATTAAAPLYVDYTRPQYESFVREFREFGELNRWIDRHTDSAAVVLAPPETRMPFVETVSRRGSLLQLSKAAWVYSAPQLLSRFDAVLHDFGVDLRSYRSHREIWTKPAETWRNLSADRLTTLAAKYSAGCVVTYSDHVLDLPKLREGEFYTVYGFPAPATATRDSKVHR